MLWLREPVRKQAHSERIKWKAPAGFWWIAASGAAMNFAMYAFSTFLPAMLTRYHGVSVARAGGGDWTGRRASGRAGRELSRRPTPRLRLAACMMAVGAYRCSRHSSCGGRRRSVGVLAIIGYGLLQMYYGLVYASIQDLVAPPARGRAMSVYLVATYLGGASWGPVATGRLSDWLARGSGLSGEAARAAGLHGAMYVVPVLAVVLAWVLWMADRRVSSFPGSGT